MGRGLRGSQEDDNQKVTTGKSFEIRAGFGMRWPHVCVCVCVSSLAHCLLWPQAKTMVPGADRRSQ